MVKKQRKETIKEEKEQETWTCLMCGEENPSDEDICQGCGAYREESSYDAIADEEDSN
jgi:ferredoxin